MASKIYQLTKESVDISIHKLREFVEQENFSGYDPYDALNSGLACKLSFGQKYIRIAWTQLLKKLPVNLRPLLGIKKDYNPKGIGLFLWSYSKLNTVNGEYLDQIKHLLDLLEKLKSKGFSGNCWGYNFHWQSRVFYLPKGTPTIVNSSFVGHALLDTYKYTQSKKALQMAISIKDFILKDLNRTREGDTFCFSYTPIDHTIVHNANLLGAALLIRLFYITKEEVLRQTALESLAYSMKYQNPQGYWYYANTKIQKWIDSFHTGFNLQCLWYFLELSEVPEYKQAFAKGIEFYQKFFFLDNGTPKYYHNKIYPIDIHSAAQAVVFFSHLPEHQAFLDKITLWMINNLQSEKGFFYFQKSRFYTNQIPYIRWGQAWAFHALSEYIAQKLLRGNAC